MATFDAAMAARLKAFQQSRGLATDGQSGPKTWQELASAEVAPKAKPDVIDPSTIPLTVALTGLDSEEKVLDFLAAQGIDVRAILADMREFLVESPE